MNLGSASIGIIPLPPKDLFLAYGGPNNKLKRKKKKKIQ